VKVCESVIGDGKSRVEVTVIQKSRCRRMSDDEEIQRAIAASLEQKDAESAPKGFVHQVKRMPFLNREVSVVLQNENGPCPLLALINALLLRGTMKLHGHRSEIGSEDMIAMVADLMLESNPAAHNDLNLQKQIEDVMKVLPTLQFGLDVNVKFSGVDQFEFDDRIAVFDLLGVNLFHGWVIDPHDEETVDVFGDLSYNQVMDKLIHLQNAGEGNEAGHGTDETVRMLKDAEIINRFLDENASQFTFFALASLHEIIKERELCAFFRNNHFSTLFKMDGKLYALVTDLGYRDSGTVGWELLDQIDGNTTMLSPSFGNPNEYVHPSDLGETLVDQITGGAKPGAEIDADQLLAMQLQNEEGAGAEIAQEEPGRRPSKNKPSVASTASTSKPKPRQASPSSQGNARSRTSSGKAARSKPEDRNNQNANGGGCNVS